MKIYLYLYSESGFLIITPPQFLDLGLSHGSLCHENITHTFFSLPYTCFWFCSSWHHTMLVLSCVHHTCSIYSFVSHITTKSKSTVFFQRSSRDFLLAFGCRNQRKFQSHKRFCHYWLLRTNPCRKSLLECWKTVDLDFVVIKIYWKYTHLMILVMGISHHHFYYGFFSWVLFTHTTKFPGWIDLIINRGEGRQWWKWWQEHGRWMTLMEDDDKASLLQQQTITTRQQQRWMTTTTDIDGDEWRCSIVVWLLLFCRIVVDLSLNSCPIVIVAVLLVVVSLSYCCIVVILLSLLLLLLLL